MKIAFDENIPIAMVKVFQTFANERQLKKLIGGKFEIKSAKDYVPVSSDPDYKAKSDVPWLKRFASDGGKVVITDNRDMRHVPQERLALVEQGFIVVFLSNQWSGWKFFRKCALLLLWWPVIAAKVANKRTKPGSFWNIPSTWKENGKLTPVSNQDPKFLKIEQQKKAGRKKKVVKPVTEALAKTSDGPLFDYAQSKPTETSHGAQIAESKDGQAVTETGRREAIESLSQKGAGNRH